MRALGRIGLQLGIGRFNHGTHPTNLSPVYRYPQPAIGRAPSPRADEQVFTFLRHQLRVQFADLARDLNRAARVKVMRFHIENIGNVRLCGIAQRIGGIAKGPVNFFIPYTTLMCSVRAVMGLIWSRANSGFPRFCGHRFTENSISTGHPIP